MTREGVRLDEEALRRFARQVVLPDLGEDGQRRLLGATVLVVGLGAAGTTAALHLAAAGLGCLLLHDPRDVETPARFPFPAGASGRRDAARARGLAAHTVGTVGAADAPRFAGAAGAGAAVDLVLRAWPQAASEDPLAAASCDRCLSLEVARGHARVVAGPGAPGTVRAQGAPDDAPEPVGPAARMLGALLADACMRWVVQGAAPDCGIQVPPDLLPRFTAFDAAAPPALAPRRAGPGAG